MRRAGAFIVIVAAALAAAAVPAAQRGPAPERYLLRPARVFDAATGTTKEGLAVLVRGARVPVVVSFTLETDGRLPTGQTLAAAIEQVDRATSGLPEYYMINCAHPTHFAESLDAEAPWARRLRGLRANASCRSHAELNEAPDLDVGDPRQLGVEYAELVRRLPWLNVFGGCCGTDTRHVDAIAAACAPLFEPSERMAS